MIILDEEVTQAIVSKKAIAAVDALVKEIAGSWRIEDDY